MARPAPPLCGGLREGVSLAARRRHTEAATELLVQFRRDRWPATFPDSRAYSSLLPLFTAAFPGCTLAAFSARTLAHRRFLAACDGGAAAPLIAAQASPLRLPHALSSGSGKSPAPSRGGSGATGKHRTKLGKLLVYSDLLRFEAFDGGCDDLVREFCRHKLAVERTRSAVRCSTGPGANS